MRKKEVTDSIADSIESVTIDGLSKVSGINLQAVRISTRSFGIMHNLVTANDRALVVDQLEEDLEIEN
jgi:hypothetical protein